MVADLKSRYPNRLILFDLPPLLAGDDVLVFAPYVDALLLVVEDGRTSRAELARAAKLLEGTNLLGSVLNRAAETSGIGY